MNIQGELHRLVGAIDLSEAKRLLDTVVDESSEDEARALLTRLRALRGDKLVEWTFLL